MSRPPRASIDISTSTLVRLALVVLGIAFLWVVRDILMIILVSIVIASAVEPLVQWFIRWRFPRVLATLLIYLSGMVFVVGIFYLLVPPLAGDFQIFFSRLPTLIETALVGFQQKVPFLSFDFVIEAIRHSALTADQYIQGAVSGFFSFSSTFFSSVLSFGFIVIISFYLTAQEDGIADVLRIVTPKEYEEYALDLWARSQRKIGRWLQGQLLLGLLVGVLVFIMLTVLRVEHAFLFAVLSAIFEIIPYFGPVMAAIPAIAVTAIKDPLLGLLVAGIYFLVQQMENHLIYPQVVRKTVGVHPLLAIIALLVGGTVAGAVGIIIAIPLAVIFVEYFNDVALHKRTI
ncbi:MAG: AI-2E family transporter [Candidatus Ryanbacteria bacterium]|nr:AI-2E family transporter [Candidatus Ryanbacteria bacterium]